MKITLDSNPSDAPGCVKIIAADGRDLLIQTDLDFPAVARNFGWDIATVSGPWAKVDGEPIEKTEHRAKNCRHQGTDGTIICPDCRQSPGEFITAARQWLDDNDGAEAEDPGYFI